MFVKLFTLLILTIKPVTIIIGGDLMPSGSMLEYIEKQPFYPFENIAPLLKSADISFFNLECPVTDTGLPTEGKEYTFKFPTQYAWIFKKANITGFTLANNHIMDYGEIGLVETIRILDSLGIGHCGAGKNLEIARKPLIKNIRGKKVGFLCYSNTLPKSYWADTSKPGTVHGVEKNIKFDLAHLDSDFKIVVFHWSGELLDTPKTYQRILAHYAINHGASMVVGHHPHVVQPIEFYNGRPIFYSLGNFVFGSYTRKANGMLVLVKIFNKGSANFFVIPIHTTYWTSRFQTSVFDSVEYIKRLSPGIEFEKDTFAGFTVFRLKSISQ